MNLRGAVLLDKPQRGGELLRSWVNPEVDLDRELARAPEHVQASLDRSGELAGAFEPRGSMQSWQEVISNTIADSTAITNVTTETIMVPNFTLPAGYLYAGRILKYSLWGRVSTVVTTPGTITFRLRWGGVSGTVLAASKAQRPKTTVSTNMAGWLEFLMTCRATGTSGSAFTMGQCQLANTIGDAAASQENIWPDAPAAVTIDTTAATALSPTIQFSVATATTSWTTHMAKLEAMN